MHNILKYPGMSQVLFEQQTAEAYAQYSAKAAQKAKENPTDENARSKADYYALEATKMAQAAKEAQEAAAKQAAQEAAAKQAAQEAAAKQAAQEAAAKVPQKLTSYEEHHPITINTLIKQPMPSGESNTQLRKIEDSIRSDTLESEELFATLFGRVNWSGMKARSLAPTERKEEGKQEKREERIEESTPPPFVSSKRYEEGSIKINPYLLKVDVTTNKNILT
jgi:hypothetical protein